MSSAGCVLGIIKAQGARHLFLNFKDIVNCISQISITMTKCMRELTYK